jgi:hypothetical protein
MKRIPGLLWLAMACAAMASGCTQALVTTTVRPDGSWSRAIRFQADELSTLRETFVLPAGAPWVTRKDWVEKQAIYNAERRMRADEGLSGDLVVRDHVANQVTVREVRPGRWEYREVLHWQGRHPAEIMNPDPTLLHALKAALPDRMATDSETRAAASAVLREFWRIWFGPDDPAIAYAVSDLAGRRVERRLDAAVDRVLRDRFGRRMTQAERRAAARRWVTVILRTARGRASSGGAMAPIGSNGTSWVALEFAVRLPGRVVATNGAIDEVAEEVSWDLYSEAPAVGDVVMTATCDLRPASHEMAAVNTHR